MSELRRETGGQLRYVRFIIYALPLASVEGILLIEAVERSILRSTASINVPVGPWNFHFLELSFPGTFEPRSEVSAIESFHIIIIIISLIRQFLFFGAIYKFFSHSTYLQ